MGRKGSLLVPFLNDALIHEKYRNLKFEDASKRVLKLNLPQKTSRLDKEDEMLFKDWFQLKGKKYKFSQDYTKAKQAIVAALKKSEYLEKVHNPNDHQLTYKILNDDEIQKKKKGNKSRKNVHNFDNDTESGYESAASPLCSKINAILKSIYHDHPFCCPQFKWKSIPKKSIEQVVEKVESTDSSCNDYGIQLIKEEDMYKRDEIPADGLNLSNDTQFNEKDELSFLCQEVPVQDLLQIPSENLLYFNSEVHEEPLTLESMLMSNDTQSNEKDEFSFLCQEEVSVQDLLQIPSENLSIFNSKVDEEPLTLKSMQSGIYWKELCCHQGFGIIENFYEEADKQNSLRTDFSTPRCSVP